MTEEPRGLRIVCGPQIHAKDGFRVFLGDEDVSDQITVKSVSFEGDADSPRLVLDMRVYAEGLEVLSDNSLVTVEHDIFDGSVSPQMAALLRQMGWTPPQENDQ